jgi:hypothetical protein
MRACCLFLMITAAPSASSSQAVFTSSFKLRYAPSAYLVEADIGVLEEATLSVLQGGLLGNDGFYANQTEVVFQLQASETINTLTFEASSVSETMTQEDWQAFVEATLPPNSGLILNAATKTSELAFLTYLSIEPVSAATRPITMKPRAKFTRLDYILLAATIVLFAVFAYVMYLNYRDWKLDRPPQNIGATETKDDLIETMPPDVLVNANEKELDELMEKIAMASEANTSLTISTTSEANTTTPTKSPKSEELALTVVRPYHCGNQEACSLGATLSGLADIVQTILHPEERGNAAIDDGTMPSNATSDAFDMVDDGRPDQAEEWMKQFRISVVESSSFASDSLQNALVTSSSSVCAGNEPEGSTRRRK